MLEASLEGENESKGRGLHKYPKDVHHNRAATGKLLSVLYKPVVFEALPPTFSAAVMITNQ